MENEVQEEKVESKEIMPIEKIRELVKANPDLLGKDSGDIFNGNMDLSFTGYVNSDDEKKEKVIKKYNKKRFNLFKRNKDRKETDELATSVYQSRYDRETWYYKRHKDTIDRFTKKEERVLKKNDNEVYVVDKSEQDETLRIGFLKMWFIVMYDLIVCTFLANLVATPFHIFRVIAELFHKMKKSVAITVAIITAVIIIALGLILGTNYIFNLAQGLS